MKEIIKYQCEICELLHDDKQEAIDCESSGKDEPLVKEGDIVKFYYQTGEFDYAEKVLIYEIRDCGHRLLYKTKTMTNRDKWMEDQNLYAFGNKELKRRMNV